MIYKLDLEPLSPFATTPVTGFGSLAEVVQFLPWQPSAWPEPPMDSHEFVMVLKRIFEMSMLMEINNVIEDAAKRNGRREDCLEHRGHVIAISLLCALDAISSYGYLKRNRRNGKQIPPFVRAHFPKEYRPFAKALLKLYRHALIHSWNLFEGAITANHEPILQTRGLISFGLLNFFKALRSATEDFLECLAGDKKLQRNARKRYNELRRTAKAPAMPPITIKPPAKVRSSA